MSGANRPKLLGFMAWLMIISGALQAIAGVFVIVERNKTEIQDALDATSNDATTMGIVMIALGVLGVLVGSSLRSGKNWARTLVGLIAVANIVGLVWAAIAYHRLHWYNVAWPTFVYALIAGYLFMDDDVQEYFAQ